LFVNICTNNYGLSKVLILISISPGCSLLLRHTTCAGCHTGPGEVLQRGIRFHPAAIKPGT